MGPTLATRPLVFGLIYTSRTHALTSKVVRQYHPVTETICRCQSQVKSENRRDENMTRECLNRNYILQ